MDLSTLTPTSREIEIRNPATGKPTGLKIEIVSVYDDRVKAVERAARNKLLRSRGKNIDADSVEETAFNKVAAAVIGWKWDGDASWGGEKLKFTPENVRKVLKNDTIRSQVEEELDEDAAFFSGSENT